MLDNDACCWSFSQRSYYPYHSRFLLLLVLKLCSRYCDIMIFHDQNHDLFSHLQEQSIVGPPFLKFGYMNDILYNNNKKKVSNCKWLSLFFLDWDKLVLLTTLDGNIAGYDTSIMPYDVSPILLDIIWFDFLLFNVGNWFDKASFLTWMTYSDFIFCFVVVLASCYLVNGSILSKHF